MKTFKQWLEDAGEVHGGFNSEDPAYCAKGVRSKFGAKSFPKDPNDTRDKKPKLLGFMKPKMKKK
jgi:hypothetical protein